MAIKFNSGFWGCFRHNLNKLLKISASVTFLFPLTGFFWPVRYDIWDLAMGCMLF